MAKKTSDREKDTLSSLNHDSSGPSKGKKTNAPFVDNSAKSQKLAQMQTTADNSPRMQQAAQLKSTMNPSTEGTDQLQEGKSNTGLPDQLKSGVEHLSGLSMDDVKVHRNSKKPAQLNAEAYAQGSDIHLAPGKEKHLPHETWHVAQQKQGRVKPTTMSGNTPVNDSPKLEKEADNMGAKAARGGSNVPNQLKAMDSASAAAQLFSDKETATLKAKATPPTDAQIGHMNRFTLAETEALYGVFNDWQPIADMRKLTRSSADIVALYTSGDVPVKPTLADLDAIEGQSNQDVLALYDHEKHEYTDLEQAEDDFENENETIWTRIAGDLMVAGMDGKESELNKANAMSKAEVMKTKPEESNSCWSWATQGFANPSVPESTVWDYFAHRTNVPDRGGMKDHATAVKAVADGNDTVVTYLNRNQEHVQAIIDNWKERMIFLEGEQGNQESQLSLMRLHLAESGFTVLDQGAPADWYICMHEQKDNVGWEHWWIRTSANNIIETFPKQDLMFLDTKINGGGDKDFEHEVPVADILPAQKEVINAAFVEKRAEIRTLLGMKEEDADDENV